MAVSCFFFIGHNTVLLVKVNVAYKIKMVIDGADPIPEWNIMQAGGHSN
jgi:hypothetical protein